MSFDPNKIEVKPQGIGTPNAGLSKTFGVDAKWPKRVASFFFSRGGGPSGWVIMTKIFRVCFWGVHLKNINFDF